MDKTIRISRKQIKVFLDRIRIKEGQVSSVLKTPILTPHQASLELPPITTTNLFWEDSLAWPKIREGISLEGPTTNLKEIQIFLELLHKPNKTIFLEGKPQIKPQIFLEHPIITTMLQETLFSEGSETTTTTLQMLIPLLSLETCSKTRQHQPSTQTLEISLGEPVGECQLLPNPQLQEVNRSNP